MKDPIKLLEKVHDAVQNWSIKLTLTGNPENIDLKDIINKLDRVINALEIIIKILKKRL